MKFNNFKIFYHVLIIFFLISNVFASFDDDQPQMVKFVKLAKASDDEDGVLLTHVPTFDTTFKILFGKDDEPSKLRTISLLNDLLFEEDNVIEQISLLPSEEVNADARTIIFDVKCRTDATTDSRVLPLGTTFIIEMQKRSQTDFDKRVVTYIANQTWGQWASLSEEHRQQKKMPTTVVQYGQVKPVWTVGILDFVMFKEDQRYLRSWLIMDPDNTHDELGKPIAATNMLKWSFVELPKVRRQFSDRTEHISELDNWLFYLSRRAGDVVDYTTVSKFSTIDEACKRLARLSPREKERLESDIDSLAVTESAMQAAIAETETRVRAETEERKTREMILDMLGFGVSKEIICKKYSMTPEMLQQIISESSLVSGVVGISLAGAQETDDGDSDE